MDGDFSLISYHKMAGEQMENNAGEQMENSCCIEVKEKTCALSEEYPSAAVLWNWLLAV